MKMEAEEAEEEAETTREEEEEESSEEEPLSESIIRERDLPPPTIYNWPLLSAVRQAEGERKTENNRNKGNIVVTLTMTKATCKRKFLKCAFCPMTVPAEEKQFLFGHIVDKHVNIHPSVFSSNYAMVLNPLFETRKKIKVTPTEITISFLKSKGIITACGFCVIKKCDFDVQSNDTEIINKEMKEHIMAHHTGWKLVEETDRNFSLFDDM
jgi:hypothetical protein